MNLKLFTRVMIKNIAAILVIIMLTSSNLSGQYFWEKIESPTEEFLRTLHFTDSLKGWVAGDSGLIFYTSDGGVNWLQQETNIKHKIMKLFFLDEENGWALAWDETGNNMFYGTYILKTTNGGENWTVEQYRDENVFLASIYFLDTLNGFIGGYPGKFLRTLDGGLNWQDVQIDTSAFAFFPPVHFNFYNEMYGFASGGAIDIAGVVWKTTNGGENWRATGVSPEPIRAVHFFDSLKVLAVGGDPEYFGASVIRSTDAGETWEYEELGIVGVATAISFRTETEAWAPLSFAQTMMYTFDAGMTWADTLSVDSSRVYDLVFTDSLTGYAVGEEGVILKYEYDYPNDVAATEISEVTSFQLYQNYPNPFNPSTLISYYLSEPADVSLRIYNVLGTHITTLVDEYQNNGNYSINWNAVDQASGTYYFQLNINGNLLTRKMVLIK